MTGNGTIIVLSGGFSEEREVSRVSASEIEKALLGSGYDVSTLDPGDFDSWCDLISEIKRIDPEIVFNGLHGAEGENGRVQAGFDLAGIRYTGSGHRASAIAMDKYISAVLAGGLGIVTPAKILLRESDRNVAAADLDLGLPLVVKPNDSGSSVGITVVERKEKFRAALDLAFSYSDLVLCEEFISGKELTVTVLGQEALTPVEIRPRKGWYDYKNKYTSGNTEYIIPAGIDDETASAIRQKAMKIFTLFGCCVYGRVDFRFDGRDLYFLEVNTLPGMTPLSLTPMAARHHGLDFPELLTRILELSQEKYN